jgi:iron complex transport system ATP-binding protein
VTRALAETDMQTLASRRVDRLSGGQRQRAWLAMLLAQETPWLLLDEPTSMLDLGHQVELLGLVRTLAHAGRGIVMVLHDLVAAARHADQLPALHEGRVLRMGDPRDVATPELAKVLCNVAVDLLSSRPVTAHRSSCRVLRTSPPAVSDRFARPRISVRG